MAGPSVFQVVFRVEGANDCVCRENSDTWPLLIERIVGDRRRMPRATLRRPACRRENAWEAFTMTKDPARIALAGSIRQATAV
jgi:hypothetical protein